MGIKWHFILDFHSHALSTAQITCTERLKLKLCLVSTLLQFFLDLLHLLLPFRGLHAVVSSEGLLFLLESTVIVRQTILFPFLGILPLSNQLIEIIFGDPH